MKLEEQNNNINIEELQSGVLLETKKVTKKPSMYKVILLNDDYTPMEFVVYVIQKCFNKNQDEATQIMLNVHKKGIGICGVYTYEVAEAKSKSVILTTSLTPLGDCEDFNVRDFDKV